MILKVLVSLAFALLMMHQALGQDAYASDVAVLPQSFTPNSDVVVCPSQDEAIELLAALHVADYALMLESGCSILPRGEVSVYELEVHVNLEVEDPVCKPDPCIDVFVAGIYRAVAYARYVVHVIGPEVPTDIPGVKTGIVADVEYESVPVAPPLYAIFQETSPESIEFI